MHQAIYQDYVIDMSVAGPGGGSGAQNAPYVEVPIEGSFLSVWGEDGPNGFGAGYVDVRLDSPSAPVIRMRIGAMIGDNRQTPFHKFLIDWPLLAGQRLGLLIGDKCFVTGQGVWSSLIGTSVPPGTIPGVIAGAGQYNTIAIANPALGTHWTYTATRRMLVWGIKTVIDTSAVAGVRAFQPVVRRATLPIQANAGTDTIAANEITIYNWSAGFFSSTATDGQIANTAGNNVLGGGGGPYSNSFIQRMYGWGPGGSLYLDIGDILATESPAAQPLLGGDQLLDILLFVQYL